jgi:formylglycine-generating enzyme required for sulfatase activity
MMWSDCVAYAAWAGLRPMTELEYEKACRGPLVPVPNEYAWGTDRIAGTNSPESPRDGYSIRNAGRTDERVDWEGENGPDATRGNAAWWGAIEQGTGSFAVHAINGPLRVGIFATSESGRVAAGASYWGILELTGNLWERLVTVGYEGGRRFAGTHGEGSLAQPAGWSFSNGHEFGIRGGGSGWWKDHSGTPRVSDRTNMFRGLLNPRIRIHQFNRGFRCVRTAPSVRPAAP